MEIWLLSPSTCLVFKNPNNNKQVINFIPVIIPIDNNVYFLVNINLWYKIEYKYRRGQQPVNMSKYITCTECSLVLIMLTDATSHGCFFFVGNQWSYFRHQCLWSYILGFSQTGFSQRSQPNTYSLRPKNYFMYSSSQMYNIYSAC